MGRRRRCLGPAAVALAWAAAWARRRPLGFAAPAGRRAPLALGRPGGTSCRFSPISCAARGGEEGAAPGAGGPGGAGGAGGDESPFRAGDRVLDRRREGSPRFGRVAADRGDGTLSVEWEAEGDASETEDLELVHVQKVGVFKDYAVGDDVMARPPGSSKWLSGVVSQTHDDGRFEVAWDRVVMGSETATLGPESLRKASIFRDYQPGDEVVARFPYDGQMRPAVVWARDADGTFQVRWAEQPGIQQDVTLPNVSPREIRYPSVNADDLEVGQRLKGIVTEVKDYGAFVDIGLRGSQALLHKSQLAKGTVRRAQDFLEVGQTVEVWVQRIHRDGKIALTALEDNVQYGFGGQAASEKHDYARFEKLDKHEFHVGVVQHITDFGAFVLVVLPDGASAVGLMHRGNILEEDGEPLVVGQEVAVRVLKADAAARKMTLCMQEGPVKYVSDSPRPFVDLRPFDDVGRDRWLRGTVENVGRFGAFVKVSPPGSTFSANGLLHRSQLRDQQVDSAASALEIGQVVRVRIQSLDVHASELKLTMRPIVKEQDTRSMSRTVQSPRAMTPY